MKRKKMSIHMTKASISLNGAIAISKVGLGIASLSFFPIISALYNIGIAIAKYFGVAEQEKAKHHLEGTKEDTLKRELKCYHLIGMIVFISSIVFVLYSFRLFIYEEKTFVFNNVVAIGIATITFAEIGIAISGIIKARKNEELIVEAIRMTNLATALISLVLTQTAIMSFTYNKGSISLYLGFAGVLFGTVSALIGLNMLRRKESKTKLHTTSKKGLRLFFKGNKKEKIINL